jgi:hypothetical protein
VGAWRYFGSLIQNADALTYRVLAVRGRLRMASARTLRALSGLLPNRPLVLRWGNRVLCAGHHIGIAVRHRKNVFLGATPMRNVLTSATTTVLMFAVALALGVTAAEAGNTVITGVTPPKSAGAQQPPGKPGRAQPPTCAQWWHPGCQQQTGGSVSGSNRQTCKQNGEGCLKQK